ncbi:MAG: MFS transporter, partial [Methylophilaceae bacterium]
TGMAIMGFGGGAMIGSPIATKLMAHFSEAGSAGVWQTFVVLGIIYFTFMVSGSFGYRIPATGWKPANWNPPATTENAMIASKHVHLNKAHKTPQFWLLWLVLCMNVSACIGILGAASPMLQETFGGALIGQPELGFEDVKNDHAMTIAAALVGAGFVGLISVFNIFGRIGWASSSDKLGRKQTYYIFFVLGAFLYCSAAYVAGFKSLSLFVACFCIISSMYGGGFATIPAYLADMFGTQFVGAIHGRILLAWSTAGILGPVIVNYMHDTRLEAGVPYDEIYGPIMLVLAGMMVIGFVANMLIKPVADKDFMTDAELETVRNAGHETVVAKTTTSAVTETYSLVMLLAWGAVLVPIAYGVWSTAQKAWSLFS